MGIVALLIFIFTPIFFSLVVSKKNGGAFTAILLLFSFLFYLLLFYLNDLYPFTQIADDHDYFEASQVEFTALSDWLDFNRFNRQFEQAGYPLFVSWIYQLSGASLYIYKASNLCLFLLLSITWYSIGNILGGKNLAIIFGITILLATPLWYYWAFILKDMCIVLLQSQFILYAIRYLSGINKSSSLFLMFLMTVILVPFRLGLVLVNIAIAAEIALLSLVGKRGIGEKIITVIAIGIALSVILFVATNKSNLKQFGVSGKNRSLDVSSVDKTLNWYGDSFHEGNSASAFGIKFPLLYLIGEVSGLNPKAWQNFSPIWLRGALAIPWIFIGIPFFFYGILAIIKNRKRGSFESIKDHPLIKPSSFLRRSETPKPTVKTDTIKNTASINNTFKPNKFGQPLALKTNLLEGKPTITNVFGFDSRIIIILSFITIYVLISWIVHDTTRWRMPSFPAIAAIAGLGFFYCSPKKRFAVMTLWTLLAGMLTIGYYLILK